MAAVLFSKLLSKISILSTFLIASRTAVCYVCILGYWIKLKQASGFGLIILHVCYMCAALLQVAVFFCSNFPSLIRILHTMFYFSSKDQLPQKLEIMSCFHVWGGSILVCHINFESYIWICTTMHVDKTNCSE